MSASSNDVFCKVGSPGTATTLAAPGHTSGGTSLTVVSTTNWPTGTGVIFAMDTVSIVDGVEVRDVGSYREFEGVVASSTSITGVTVRLGSDRDYAAGTTTRVYIPVAGSQNDRMVDGLLVEHDQDGTHGAITAASVASAGAVTATSVTATTGTFTNLTVTGTSVTAGWSALGDVPDTVTYNGNRSYSLVFNGVDHTSTLSNGMRLQTTRTVSAPTQCTSLNGTTQYYNKTSPNGMTFTDDFVVSGWVKVSAYTTQQTIASRYNGTSGWRLMMDSTGQVTMTGFNSGAANYSQVVAYQSIPLNKWVHIAAQLDMSTFTATTTTSYVMIDGVDVPASVSRGGTNPTSLIQAGNLEVGSWNGGLLPFNGKIAQVAIYSAKVTQANVALTYSQGLAGTETSLISAYSFNNSINDLNANANNLTAQGSAVATNADSPFAQDDAGAPTGTTDCGIVQSVSFSTNTTVVVQVPEGCTIPTSGGVSTVLYSLQKAPFGFPTDSGRYRLTCLFKVGRTQSSPTQNTWYNMTTISGTSGGAYLTLTVAGWFASYFVNYSNVGTTNTIGQHTLSTGASTETDTDFTTREGAAGANTYLGSTGRSKHINVTTQAPYYLNTRTDQTGMTSIGDNSNTLICADLANL